MPTDETSAEDLIAAVQAGDEQAVIDILESAPRLARATSEQGVPVLMLALYHRQPSIAERIAAQRTDLSLHELTALGRSADVARLLDAGAALEGRSTDGFTPLQYAAFFGHEAVVRLLVERGADVNAAADNPMKVQPLHSAAAIGSVDICRRLLEAGADANGQQQAGYTALMSAALHGNEALVRLLLEHGADPGVQAEDGRTARDLALEGGHSELAESLLG